MIRIHKKLPHYDTALAIALMLSVLQIDWTSYLRDDIETNSIFHDVDLGPSVGLAETQFHNLYNSIGHINSKNIITDSYYDRSALRELDTLYEGPRAVITPRTRIELTAFLLDQLESNSRSHSGQVVVQPPQNPSIHHVNTNNGGNQVVNQGGVHESDSDEGFEEMEIDMEALEGAVGHAQAQSVSPTPSDELSIEDMDLIESLWRQDIDMGVCPDTYPYKADINKPGFTEELKKQGIDLWDYNIDGETGEYMPGPQPELGEENQRTVLPQVPVVPQPLPNAQPQQEAQLPQQDSSLSLEDCLQLLEDEYSPDTAQTDISPGLSQQEAEQRWQDLATISELQGSIPEILPNNTVNNTQEGFVASQQHYMGGMPNGSNNLLPEPSDVPHSQPPLLNDVFAVNASTNGMVSLQNATQSHQQPLLMTPTHNDTYNNFSNANVDSLNHAPNTAASVVPSTDNATTDYLMNLQHQLNTATASAPYSAANLSLPDNSTSLLMELLNSPGAAQPINPLDLDFDEQMHDVISALGEEAESLSDEEESDGSIFDDSEGATGYSSSPGQDSYKGAAGGYDYSRGHERQYGSDSSSNSYSGNPPKMENISHNHSYAAPSQSQMQNNGNGAQNNSHNGLNNKLNRDEKRAKALKLPVAVEKIIHLPVDAFNDLLKKYDLNDAQMQLVRDIRRRGKNKVAAQNCRKRKIDAISLVESTVGELRMERDKLMKERDNIDKEVNEMQQRYADLCDEVFSSVQDEHGGPVDPNDFILQQMPDGSVYLVPRNGNSSSHIDREEHSM